MRGLYQVAAWQLSFTLVLAKPCEPRNGEPKWAEIPSSSSLEWVPCYDKADCARLEVPMDYDDPDGAKVILAVIRHNATDREHYKGPVLFNSGGPNNSGVDWFQDPDGRAAVLHDTVGRNHDIVTWDPRSFSRSVPRISCWATEQRRNLWAATSPGLPHQYDDPGFLATMRHRAAIENSACIDMVGDTGILQHVSTTHSARDLHSLMTALGQDSLRYVGQSYGCLLGTFFASMYPDKIERIVCDGNIDPRDVLSGDYITERRDTDKLLDFFAESCAADERCLIHEPTAAAVLERVNSIVENSRYAPAFVVAPPIFNQFDYVTQAPTHTLVANILMFAIGNPYGTTFRDIAAGLMLIEAGGYGTAENLLSDEQWPGALTYLDTTYRSPFDPDAGRKGFDNKYPITEDWTICNDLPAFPDDLVAYRALLDEAKARDPMAPVIIGLALNCIGRPRPQGSYTGPFGGNTSHPIFFVNALVDPSTSVRMAYSNAEQFSGSGLLVYNAVGHSVTFFNKCVLGHINTYFQEGTLPPAGTECENTLTVEWGF